MNGWTDGRMSGWMNERIDRLVWYEGFSYHFGLYFISLFWPSLDKDFCLQKEVVYQSIFMHPLYCAFAKLFCHCYVTTRSYSDNWMLPCELAWLGGIVWPPADASFDFVICNLARVGLSWENRLARAFKARSRALKWMFYQFLFGRRWTKQQTRTSPSASGPQNQFSRIGRLIIDLHRLDLCAGEVVFTKPSARIWFKSLFTPYSVSSGVNRTSKDTITKHHQVF